MCAELLILLDNLLSFTQKKPAHRRGNTQARGSKTSSRGKKQHTKRASTGKPRRTKKAEEAKQKEKPSTNKACETHAKHTTWRESRTHWVCVCRIIAAMLHGCHCSSLHHTCAARGCVGLRYLGGWVGWGLVNWAQSAGKQWVVALPSSAMLHWQFSEFCSTGKYWQTMGCCAAVTDIAALEIFRVFFSRFLQILQELKAESLDIVNL